MNGIILIGIALSIIIGSMITYFAHRKMNNLFIDIVVFIFSAAGTFALIVFLMWIVAYMLIGKI